MKKLILLMLCILIPGLCLHAEDVYKLVKTTDGITPDGTYIIAASGVKQADGKSCEYIMGAFGSKNFKANIVTTNNSTITLGTTVATKLKFETATGGYVIKDLNNSKYLASTAAKTMSEKASLSDATIVAISFSGDNVTIDFGTAGTLQNFSQKSQAPVFNTYTSDQKKIRLYKLQECDPSKTAVTLGWDRAAAEAVIGEDFTPPILSYSPNTEEVKSLIQYSSSNTAVADFTGEQLNIKAAGTTTISAAIPADNTTYSSNTATYTLTVNPEPFDPSKGYQIVFKSGNNKAGTSNANSETIIKNGIETGKEFVSSISGQSLGYNATNGLKTGSSSSAGNVTITLSDLGKVKATKIVAQLAQYDDPVSVKIQEGTAAALTSDLRDYTYEYTTPTEISTIKLEASTNKRFFVKAITVYTAAPTAVEPLAFAPANGSTVMAGDVITISSKTTDAVITYTVNGGTELNGNSYTVPATFNNGDKIVIVATAVKDGLDPASATATYTVYKNEPVAYNPTLEDMTMRVGDEARQIALGETHPAISYAVSPEGIVTVSEAGMVTAVGAGEAEVTVSWAGNEDWTEGSARFNVTVKDALKDPGLSFRHAEIVGKLGVGIAAQAAYRTSDGTITYTSSNEGVVRVNVNTGMITPADVIAVGEAIITATIAETDTYAGATATYKVRIETPETGSLAPAGDYMFDFSKSPEEGGAYGMYPYSANKESITEIDSEGRTVTIQLYEKDRERKDDNKEAKPVTEIRVNPVTLTFGENDEYRYWNGVNNYHLRLYHKAGMTFSVPEGYSIEKITVNTIDYKKGAFIEANVGTWNKDDGSWTAPTGNNIRNVTLTNGNAGGYVQIPTMTVILKKAESDRTLANLQFAQRVYNAVVNEATIINAVTHAEELEGKNIAYSIDNLTGSDYIIEKNEDGTLKTIVNIPGVYTLRARSAATETLLPGVAILRLNVFPVLNVSGTNVAEETDGYKILSPEGGEINVTDAPSTVQVHYWKDGDAGETVHDGGAINVTEDGTYNFHMIYAETENYKSADQTLHVVLRPTQPTYIPSQTSCVINAPEGTTLYYRTEAVTAGQAPARAIGFDESQWTSANGTTYTFIPGDTDTRVMAVAVKDKVAMIGKHVPSDITDLLVKSDGTTTGIETIDTDNNTATAEYYTLQGIRVENPTTGYYIRRQGDTAAKVYVK